jgi:hypothetical protein
VPPRRWRATAVASMRCQAAVLRGSQPQPLRPSMGAPLRAAPWLSRVRRTNETRRQKRHTPQGRFRPRPGRMILDAENGPIARHISRKRPNRGYPLLVAGTTLQVQSRDRTIRTRARHGRRRRRRPSTQPGRSALNRGRPGEEGSAWIRSLAQFVAAILRPGLRARGNARLPPRAL